MSNSAGVPVRRVLPEVKVRHLANVFIIVSVLAALGATLYPFDFTASGFDDRLGPFLHPQVTNLQSIEDDVITNIILFLPVGFSFGILATRKRFRPVSGFLLVTAAGGFLSLGVEVAQLFLPFRFSSFFDVASNTAGSAAGFVLYKTLARAAYQRIKRVIERANDGHLVGLLTAGYVVYLACILLGSLPLQMSSFLGDFNKTSYPLLVGNEPGGDRPWTGVIRELIVAKYPFSYQGIDEYLTGRELNQADSKDVVAHYIFTGTAPYRDLTKLHSPLEWRGKTPDSASSEEADITPRRWLQTNKEAYNMSSWMMATLRFTICLNVASKDAANAYLARIMSVSSDPYHRNFSILQHGEDLIARFRSMTTGTNGTRPQFLVANVFQDTLMHRIVVTLTPSLLEVYVDNINRKYEIELGPGFALLNRFFPSNGKLYISSPMRNFHRVMYYFIAFIPLGYLLSQLVLESPWGIPMRLLICCVGCAAPPYLLDKALCWVISRELNSTNLLIGLGVMFGTVAVTLSVKYWRRTAATTGAFQPDHGA